MHDERGPYSIVRKPGDTPPKLPGRVLVREDAGEAADTLAADLFGLASTAARNHGEAHIALQATPAIEPLLRVLLIDPTFRWFPWEKTHVWLVDEVWRETVDETGDARLRYPVLRDYIVEHSGIPAANVHAIGSGGVDEGVRAAAEIGARQYADALRAALIWRTTGSARMDVCVLTVMPTKIEGIALAADYLDESGDVAIMGVRIEDEVGAGKSEVCASSMTPAMVSRSECVCVLAAGAAVRPHVVAWDMGERKVRGVPMAGEMRWYVDRDACPE